LKPWAAAFIQLMNGSILSSGNKLVRSASVPAERLKQIDGIFIDQRPDELLPGQ
jgi:hypothetical protein